ncbi:MAG: UpxY family transcription antiterminator [Prevotella sp.]|nr:UpxY family transcription antiterminator [Prevotella sp.]
MEETFWFIAVVTPNTETACKDRLEKMFRNDDGNRIETYVPMQRELHEWPSTGRRHWVYRRICPCHLFIRCTRDTRYTIACQAKFILHFMMDRARHDNNGRPDFAIIPHDQMIDFQRMVGDADTPVTIDTSRLQIGSKVRVKSGRLAGIEGFLVRAPKGKPKLAIRIDMLGYATTEFPIELLEEV